MKFFELQFNRKTAIKEKGLVFGSFCYSPKTRQEKKLGLLYLIAELKNSSEKEQTLLETLAQSVKDGFYESQEAENALQNGLDRANQAIAQEKDKGNFSFVGNLNCAAVTLLSPFTAQVSTLGKIKIILFRENDAFDLSYQNREKTPLLAFPDFIEGILQKKDRLLLLTENAMACLQQEKMLEQIANFAKPKIAQQFFKENKKTLQNFYGAMVLIFIKKVAKPLFAKKNKAPSLAAIKFGTSKIKTPASKIESAVISAIVLVILLLLGVIIF